MSRKTRKLIWSVPLVAAVAAIGALAAFMTLAPNGVFADSAPGAPTITSVAPVVDDLTTTDMVEGRTMMQVEWTAPDVGADDPAITGYRIDAAIGVKNSQVWRTLMADTDSTATSYTHTGISASTSGTTVYYRVYAISVAGTGPVSAAGSNATVPQSEPKRTLNVDAEAQGPTQINVSWDPPRDDGGKPITGYRIHIDPPEASGVTDTGFPATTVIDNPNTKSDRIVIVDASATSWKDTGRNEKETYRYQVYAINSIGTSKEDSNIDSATTTDAVAPDEPTNLRAVLTGATIQLYWHWPASEGGSPVTQFRIEVSKSNKGPGAEVDGGDALTENEADAAAQSLVDEDEVVFNVSAADTSIEPSDVYDVQHTHGIPFDDDETLTYRVFAETAPGGLTLRSTDSGETTVIVPACATVDANGDDVTSCPTAPEDNPRMPVGNDTIPGPLAVDDDGAAVLGTDIGYDQINLEWSPGSDEPGPVSYRLDVSTDGVEWSSREVDTRSITNPNYEHKRLKAGTTYFYRVFPVSGDQIGPASGQGPAPAAVAAITTGVARAPGNVDNVKADSKGRPGQITLTWDAPTFDDGRPNNGGRKITHYLIRYHEEDEEYSTASDVHGNVSAESGVGTEGTTELVLATPDLPDDTKLVDVTMTTWEHKGLDDDTTYRYEIRAINNIARNNVIEALSAPLEAVDNTGPSVKPGAPMYLIAEDAKDSNSDVAGDTGVLLLWSAPADPSGDDVDHYMIERKVMGEDDDKWQVLVRSWPAVKSYYTDPDGPEEGQIYYYRLNASNDVDTSGWSNEYRLPMHDEPHGARTEPMLGAAATDVMATANADGSVTLSWTADPAATHYFVAGIDADTDPDSLVWEFADNLGSHTVTAELDGDALASSETYRFLVIAGRWMESGGTWTGSWGSTWSNVDMATIN